MLYKQFVSSSNNAVAKPRVYVCMYVRMYVCIYTCMYLRMYVHTRARARGQWNTVGSHHPSVYIKCNFVLRILSASSCDHFSRDCSRAN